MQRYLITNRTLGVGAIIEAETPAAAFADFNLEKLTLAEQLWGAEAMMDKLTALDATAIQPTTIENVFKII